MKTVEPIGWVALLVVLSALVLHEGAHAAALEKRETLSPRALYALLAKGSTAWQIVDVRADPKENYEDSHVPGALPFPGCKLDDAPAAARDHILSSVPTIVVSDDGSAEAFAPCAAHFTRARNLAGGFTAWDDENLPEDSGEYVAPKAGAGGGCL